MKRRDFGAKKGTAALLLAVSVVASFAGCSNSNNVSGGAVSSSQSDSNADGTAQTAASSEVNNDTEGVRTIYVGAGSSGYPLEFIDDNGEWSGYEVEALRRVDEALPQYQFEFVDASSQDSVYTGLSTGKYQIAITNAFYTDERANNYNIPENQLGASPCGLVVRKENADILTLEQAATAGISIAPLMAGDGLTYQIEKYNKENPDNQIPFEYADSSSQWTDCIMWVSEGRYDFAIFPKTYYEQLVVVEDGALHQYYDNLSYEAVIPVETYAIIAKGEDQLTEDISEVLGQLKEDGTLQQIAVEFFGFDPFASNASLN